MKVAVLALCVAAVLSNESVNLDEGTALVQETAGIDAGMSAKTGVKVTDAAKAKVGGQNKARATVMIGTHELDAEEVEMAKSHLQKITMKLGARHPIFLGESAQIADFTQAGTEARYVKGGYAKLTTILKKVDEFNAELEQEKKTAVKNREKLYDGCDSGNANFNKQSKKRTADVKALQEKQKERYTSIQAKQAHIANLLVQETTKAAELKRDTEAVDKEYKAYWTATEDRHQVRNVLMQALWLVCTGFATFRHTEYCTNIRQQPDFDEPAIKQPTADAMKLNDGPSKLAKMIRHSTTFGQTMQPVWEQQKVADRSTVNSLDGDVDMEKGFVNNKAPWGVDPAGMSARVGGEEELGESNESQDMTNEEMSSRLSFLLESSAVPERIASPINAFIQALDSNDVAVQGSLVSALVDMDTQEGQSQSTLDYQWYSTIIAKRKIMYNTLKAAQALKHEGRDTFEGRNGIEDLQAAMKKAQQQEAIDAAQFVRDTATQKGSNLNCNANIVEVEALIETCNEELTNIQRLNSLLRYLVVGDKAKCSGDSFDCKNPELGSCTWRNRGAGKSAETAKDCETETGKDIPCDYSGSDPLSMAGPKDNAAQFCACEYGFFGSKGGDRDCNLKTCPGYGRIRYPKNQQQALMFYNKVLTLANGTPTKHPVLAVCSGIYKEEHGHCNVKTGQCDSCYVSPGDPKKVTPPLIRDNGIVTVNNEKVSESMPYSGAAGKCEEWFVPHSKVGDKVKWTVFGDPAKCSGKGEAEQDKKTTAVGAVVYHTGKCICNVDRYGQACELTKMQMSEGEFYPKDNPVACNGRGIAIVTSTPATCTCSSVSTGKTCQEIRCPGFDKVAYENGVKAGASNDPECGTGVGVCNTEKGRCNCVATASCGLPNQPLCPGACVYNDCQANCGGTTTDGDSSSGLCDRFSGLCSCNFNDVFNGPTCVKPERGAVNVKGKVQEMIWTSSMDKWGWSTCETGYLLTGMKTDRLQTMDALYNLDRGFCQQPFESSAAILRGVEPSRCYHENWWKKFDTRGGKFCRRNYFVAGLFRSHCNSLYCIEMAKCCSVKRSIWTDCKWKNTKDWISTSSGIQVDGDQGFIVGFFRGAEHTLGGITSVRQCTPMWYGQLYKYKTRFDN